MSRINNIKQPRQRLSYKSKTKTWRKENVDFGNAHSFYNNSEVRSSLKNKTINLNLYNGVVNVADMMDVVNPNREDASYIPDNIPHHPILVPKIDLLVGEELNRPFDYSFIVTDSESITRKMEDKKQEYYNRISEFLQENYTDEELDQKMQELQKHMKYTWKDIREKMANQIIKYYYEKENFRDKFNKGFKDALLFAEEAYLIDVIHDEPVLTVLNPLKVRTVQSGSSNRFEDASIIIIEDFKSPNRLVDEYCDELKPTDVDYLLDYNNSGGSSNYTDDHNNHLLLFNPNQSDTYDTLFEMAEINGHFYGSDYTDQFGNIRELKVRWKSVRKVKKIKYYDEFGKVQYRFESEEYIVDKKLGEEETAMWVSEGWEGTMLGKDIYLKMRPLPVQYSAVNQPHKNHLGIIGQLYNTNQGKPVSLMDRGKNYQYLYNAIWDRLNKAIATNYGKILEVDLAKIPANWQIEKWLHFAYVNKIAVVDSFKEGNKGASTGRLAGGMNTVGGHVMDMETGAYIQQHIELLEFIKMEMSEIIGITRQREGQVHNRETVGGVERSVNQSSHITEYWYNTHESVKRRVLEAFLETAKYTLRRQGNKQVQYVMDDQTYEVLNMTANDFCESDYGVFITNSNQYKELDSMLKENAQAFLQNGGGFSTIMDIAFSNSLMDKRRKIEQAEEDMNARNSEQAQAANELAKEEQAMQAEQQAATLEFNYYKAEMDDATKRYIAELSSGNKESSNDDGIANILDTSKLDFDYEKLKTEKLLKMKELDNDMKKHSKDIKVKEESNRISKIQKKSTK